MADYLTTDTELTSVANAIRTKGGTSSSLVYPTGFVSAINAISTGTDVSDTTATASDVLTGKYFYTAAGVKAQGTLPDATGESFGTPPPHITIICPRYGTTDDFQIDIGMTWDEWVASSYNPIAVYPWIDITEVTGKRFTTSGTYVNSYDDNANNYRISTTTDGDWVGKSTVIVNGSTYYAVLR